MDDPGIPPFGGADATASDLSAARVVVLPVCYECAPSYGAGAGEGALHLLEASAQLEMTDEETLAAWGHWLIHTLPLLTPSRDPETAVSEIQAAGEAILQKGKFLLSVGGDHAVAIGLVRAAVAVYPDVGVLQIDAHADLRDAWNGSRYNHACVMRRVREDVRGPVVQVGIRSFSPEEADYMRETNIRPFFAHEIDPFDHAWMEQVVAALPDKVYLTFDLDGLDPSVLPGTGTPEPGGLSYRQAVRLIELTGRRRTVIGADITELCKIEGSRVSEYTAARIAQKVIVYCALKPDP